MHSYHYINIHLNLLSLYCYCGMSAPHIEFQSYHSGTKIYLIEFLVVIVKKIVMQHESYVYQCSIIIIMDSVNF